MKNFILIVFAFFLTTSVNSQEKKVELKNTNKFQTGIGVVDMKKILSQSTAYQNIVEQFEDIKINHGSAITKMASANEIIEIPLVLLTLRSISFPWAQEIIGIP